MCVLWSLRSTRNLLSSVEENLCSPCCPEPLLTFNSTIYNSPVDLTDNLMFQTLSANIFWINYNIILNSHNLNHLFHALCNCKVWCHTLVIMPANDARPDWLSKSKRAKISKASLNVMLQCLRMLQYTEYWQLKQTTKRQRFWHLFSSALVESFSKWEENNQACVLAKAEFHAVRDLDSQPLSVSISCCCCIMHVQCPISGPKIVSISF